jgi:hypothetical protein
VPPLYVAPGIEAVRETWAQSGATSDGHVAAQLDAYAEALRSHVPVARAAATVLVQGWGLDQHLLHEPLTVDGARFIVARDHGFGSWADVTGMADVDFESAVDASTQGDAGALTRLLEHTPTLTVARSAYGHHATLLHYVAANGVEIRRQVVPSNAAEIAGILLDHGADVRATMPVYGGQYDTLALMRTSAHPYEAGIAEELESVLGG